jgi:hypothetical protein
MQNDVPPSINYGDVRDLEIVVQDENRDVTIFIPELNLRSLRYSLHPRNTNVGNGHLLFALQNFIRARSHEKDWESR